MGLRLKIIVTLLAILSAMAGLSVWVVREQLLADGLVQERVEADKDLRRLLLALDAQLVQLDVVLGSWSNYTAMYDHVLHPSAAFRRDEVTAASLQAGHIDWFYLLDAAGRPLEHAEVATSDGARPMQARAQQLRAGLLADIGVLARGAQPGCGLSLIGAARALLCFRPLLRSDRSGPARGTVVIGRWLTPAMMESVQRQTKLKFQLLPAGTAPAGVRVGAPVEAQFAQGVPALSLRARELDMELPVSGIGGQAVALLRMTAARTTLERLQQSRGYLTRGLVLLILLTGIGMMVVVDRLVVRRLGRLEQELRSVVDSKHWAGQLDVSGQDEIGRLAQYANGMIQLVRQQMVELTAQSTTDALTALPNRRKFDECVARMLAIHQRHGRGGALVLVDVDFFKRYNDSYGHPAGDQALQAVARCLSAVARRPEDLAARLGGEEFALLLEAVDLAGAMAVAQQACAAVQALGLAHRASEVQPVLTISCGVAPLRAGDSAELLYSRADQALYRAKSAGRNQVAA